MAKNKGFRFKKAFEVAGGLVDKLSKPVANIAVRHFESNFDKEGFVDSGLQKWKEVQRRISGTRAYKYGTTASRTNPILRGKGSGVLAKSIRDKRARKGRILIGVIGKADKYAGFHNYGSGKIPQRQFMGDSKQLDKKIIDRIDRELLRVLKTV